MTLPLNIYPANSTIYLPFDSFNSSGASVTATDLAVTDIEVYKNGSVTQRASDAGYVLLDTDGLDFDGLTGLHAVSIDLSDNTDSGFYAVGSQYMVAIAAITIDGQTVRFWAERFRIVAAESVAGKPKVDVDAWLGTAAATPTVAGVPEVDITHYGGSAGTFASGRPEVNTTHAAGTAWGSGAITAGVIATDAIGAAELAADAGTELATAVWASATRVLTANTNLNDLSAAGVRTAVGLASANLDTQLGAIDDFLDTEIAAIKAKTDALPADPADASDIAASHASISASIAALNNISVAQILTTAMTEAYAANGAAPTLAQSLFAIHQAIMQFGISGTSKTVKKLDNSTTAFVVTHDSATAPTSASRV